MTARLGARPPLGGEAPGEPRRPAHVRKTINCVRSSPPGRGGLSIRNAARAKPSTRRGERGSMYSLAERSATTPAGATDRSCARAPSGIDGNLRIDHHSTNSPPPHSQRPPPPPSPPPP